MTIHLHSFFLPGTRIPITKVEIEEMVKARREVLKRHRHHEAVQALGELLDLQVMQFAGLALDVNCDNREQAVGAHNAIAYIAGVLSAILGQPDQNKADPQAE